MTKYHLKTYQHHPIPQIQSLKTADKLFPLKESLIQDVTEDKKKTKSVCIYQRVGLQSNLFS